MMMFPYKLVRMIEIHANQLALELLDTIRSSSELSAYDNVPPEELKECVYEIYRHLGNCLLDGDARDVEVRYTLIGAHRAAQRVPLRQLIRAIVLTKENLWEFLKKDSLIDRPIEVFGELELLQLFDQFFDSAIYDAAIGYEHMSVSEQHELAAAGRNS
jgi:hypothetical protein